ncbi:hypothetical protein LY90DRAFT_640274 [Neocallimastix californiae]|uniref:Uncharacterized protein n=1 Tax=Neocallimastix californiae TaxID=1754190 RepID=A0A1Y1YZP2_9FUNG|nr:hypothetical protein LY90DRAFT_640274 [Neocallimastix californiae]|eukprot:ORY03167.1 hypothetical protein LY90DRAFT_640274 [Neocallimastix californiae]
MEYFTVKTYRYLICAKVIDQLKEFQIKPAYESLCKSLYNVTKNPSQMKLLWSVILQKTNNRPDCINSTHVSQQRKKNSKTITVPPPPSSSSSIPIESSNIPSSMINKPVIYSNDHTKYISRVTTLSSPIYHCNNSIPNNSIPNNSIPNNSIPNNSIPNNSIPNNSIPNNSIPNNSIPNNSIPNNSIPNNSIPNNSIPNNSISNNNKVAIGGESAYSQYITYAHPMTVPTTPTQTIYVTTSNLNLTNSSNQPSLIPIRTYF